MLDYDIDPDNIHVGPSDHVPWLLDRKYCYIVMEGTTFGDVPLKAEMKLEVWDSPNSAGVVIDAMRCLKLGLDRGLKGALVAPVGLLQEEPAHPAPRRHRLQPRRGLHPRRGQRDPRRHRDPAQEGQAGGPAPRRQARPSRPSESRNLSVGSESVSGAGATGVAATEAGRTETTGAASKGAAAPAQAADEPARAHQDVRGAAPHGEGDLLHAPRGLDRRELLAHVVVDPRPPSGRARRTASAAGSPWSATPPARPRRRWLRANFGHVLGVPPNDKAAGHMARAAYRNYSRYIMELMRLPWLKPAAGRRPARGPQPRPVPRDLQRLQRRGPGGRPPRQQRGGGGRLRQARPARSTSSATTAPTASCTSCSSASARAGASR